MAETPRPTTRSSTPRPTETDIRVLIVDDHDVVVDGIRLNLETQNDIKVVGACGRGKDVLGAVAQTNPTVVILDIKLPDMDGIRVAEDLRAQFPKVAVLMISAFAADPQYVVRALQAHVAGYIDKNQPRGDLIQAVRSVAAGMRVWNAVANDIIQGSIRPPELNADPDARSERLTEREVEVLQEVAKGLANKQIAVRLGIKLSVVKTHVHHILNKLNVKDREAAVLEARYRGML